jgi:hypothetical protein
MFLLRYPSRRGLGGAEKEVLEGYFSLSLLFKWKPSRSDEDFLYYLSVNFWEIRG